MIKKALILLIAIAASALAAMAQSNAGSWNVYPAIGDKFDNVVETPDKVYFLTGSSLFSLGLDDNEAYAYNSQNKLSDPNPLDNIYYNAEKGF